MRGSLSPGQKCCKCFSPRACSFLSSCSSLGCLVVAISSAPAAASAASLRDVYASCVCRKREWQSLLSSCAALSPPSPLPPPPFLGSWCLTQTCAFDTHTQTQVKDALLCATSGRQAGGAVSLVRAPYPPPLPRRPTPRRAQPSPLGSQSTGVRSSLNPLGPALQRRGRATDAQDLLTLPPLSTPPPFPLSCGFLTTRPHFFFRLLERVTD